MSLAKLYIKPSSRTPEILLDPDGIIKISGRGLSAHRTEIPGQILRWLDVYITNPAETTYVILIFEYLNSYNTAILVSFLRKLMEVQTKSNKLVVRWYYEPDDDDILERGQYIASVIDLPLEYIMITKKRGD
jgi:hypothetical protein